MIVPEKSPARMPPTALKPSTTERIALRGLDYNVRRWGPADAPRVFLLHGWMDTSATFQFVVDALRHDWQLIAPDWRGYGQSTWLNRPYWFPDYYADLDALLAHYAPDTPARVVGHSMGANIASIYAGLRPQRVAQLAMLDFIGLKPPADADSPTVLGRWLDEERDLHADYARILGGPAREVVRVWLIANSLFQRGHGRCEYASIHLVTNEGTLEVL